MTYKLQPTVNVTYYQLVSTTTPNLKTESLKTFIKESLDHSKTNILI